MFHSCIHSSRVFTECGLLLLGPLTWNYNSELNRRRFNCRCVPHPMQVIYSSSVSYRCQNSPIFFPPGLGMGASPNRSSLLQGRSIHPVSLLLGLTRWLQPPGGRLSTTTTTTTATGPYLPPGDGHRDDDDDAAAHTPGKVNTGEPCTPPPPPRSPPTIHLKRGCGPAFCCPGGMTNAYTRRKLEQVAVGITRTHTKTPFFFILSRLLRG